MSISAAHKAKVINIFFRGGAKKKKTNKMSFLTAVGDAKCVYSIKERQKTDTCHGRAASDV